MEGCSYQDKKEGEVRSFIFPDEALPVFGISLFGSLSIITWIPPTSSTWETWVMKKGKRIKWIKLGRKERAQKQHTAVVQQLRTHYLYDFFLKEEALMKALELHLLEESLLGLRVTWEGQRVWNLFKT